MNENIVEGAVREFGGNVKKAAGNLTEDRELQAEGAADSAGGRAQKSLGHVQAAVEDALAPAIDFAKKQPLAALGIAAAAGAALFAALGRRPNA